MSNTQCAINIVEIAMLTIIESTFCLHCGSSVLFTSSTSQRSSTSGRHRIFFILFHRQHRRNSNIDRHRIDIVHLLSCLYRQHRNVVRHRVSIVPFLRCNQCKFNIGSTSYTLPCGRCKRQRNVSKVDGVNSISVKHRRCCEVDDVNVKEISSMSYDVMLILYQCCIHRHGDNIEKGICIGHVWRMSDC